MSLLALLQQGSEPFDLEGFFEQLVRFGILALFFLGPLLKSIFEKLRQGSQQAPASRRPRRVPRTEPTSSAPAERARPDVFDTGVAPFPADLEPVPVPPERQRPRPPAASRVDAARPVPASAVRERAASRGSLAALGALPATAQRSAARVRDERDAADRDARRRRRARALAGWRAALVRRELLDPPVALRPASTGHVPPA